MGRELRETETTLGVKADAFIRFDTVVGGVGRVLIGYCELAGFPNYAEKIRLSLPSRQTQRARAPPTRGRALARGRGRGRKSSAGT